MYDYDTQFVSEYSLLRDVEDLLTEKRSKLKQIMNRIYIVYFLLLAIFLGIALVDVDNIDALVIEFTFSSLVVFIIYLAIYGTMKSNILYDVIIRQGVLLFNQNHDTTFAFELKPKLEKTFNQDMGLFTRYASISTKYQIKGSTERGEDITLSLCSLTTSNGKSSTTHFRGVYITLPIKGISTQQLRSNGKPKLQGVKFDRVEDYPEDKIYVLEGETSHQVSPFLLNIFEELPNLFDIKYRYVGTNETEVHIGLWITKYPTLPKEVTQTSLEEIIDPLHKMMQYTLSVLERYQEMN